MTVSHEIIERGSSYGFDWLIRCPALREWEADDRTYVNVWRSTAHCNYCGEVVK